MLDLQTASKAAAKFASVFPLPAVDIPLNPPCIKTFVNKLLHPDGFVPPKLASIHFELF